MEWYVFDTWIVAVGALCAAACALAGSFLVLRRMSMMGDAISHAVLPGLAVAFLLTGSRTSVVMFIGAAATGVLTAVFTQWVSRLGNVERGASMGIVFTTLFALGLLLIARGAERVDLDPGCVLFGAIELTPLDVVADWTVFGVHLEIPRAFVVLGVVFLLNLAVVVFLFKELRISAFDPALATTLGLHAGFMHYLLMTMVAVTTVAAFEAVGSILVIAMLIVPPAAAHLLTDRLGTMVVLSVVLGVFCAAGGHAAAVFLPALTGHDAVSTSGMMAVAAGILFFAAALFAPRHGILAKGRRSPRG